MEVARADEIRQAIVIDDLVEKEPIHTLPLPIQVCWNTIICRQRSSDGSWICCHCLDHNSSMWCFHRIFFSIFLQKAYNIFQRKAYKETIAQQQQQQQQHDQHSHHHHHHLAHLPHGFGATVDIPLVPQIDVCKCVYILNRTTTTSTARNSITRRGRAGSVHNGAKHASHYTRWCMWMGN